MLEVSGVRVGDGEAPAVRQASLHVGEGELVTIVGAPGSGKTATLEALSGLRSVAAGAICFEGMEITRLPAVWRAELGMAFVPAGGDLWLKQTVHENLILGAYGRRSRRVRTESLERVYALFPEMEGCAGRPASELSESEQRTLAIARALMSRPRLLMLDEPGPEVLGVIQGLNAEGISILLAQRTAIDRSADRTYVMDSGTVRQRH
ncbi:ABC transporter ATP-binding protein [Nonomuraea sp. NPDC050556]|uniref:ABC transporter ATP-binding protein n=1 Tax=Nonomuraea sp. NPDC050556 TaxID=3364369 RepID=UPI0037A9DD36